MKIKLNQVKKACKRDPIGPRRIVVVLCVLKSKFTKFLILGFVIHWWPAQVLQGNLIYRVVVLHQYLVFSHSKKICFYLAKGFPLWLKWYQGKNIIHFRKHQILTSSVRIVV